MTGKKAAIAPEEFMSKAGHGRELCDLKRGETFFVQGGSSDCVFYLHSGRAKLTVLAHTGKQAVLTQIKAGDFMGEDAVGPFPGHRMATATALTACHAMKIQRQEMLRVMREEGPLTDRFMTFLLNRSMQVQADLVEQLFNSKERRLARILLLMAQFGQPGELQLLLPHVTHSRLAEMVGATVREIGLFMKHFSKLGFVEEDDRIRIHRSLLNIVLRDQETGQNAVSAPLLQAGTMPA